ncbi:Conserved_hypothetical protein [Hexamita inflata]|uniref:Uncharacterized protein n=1 Tax=Hexamita inflata TaxID=28002 RepID=A0AA86TFR6_9EUKA|nr:Conserved hypothetical protein [Hexamita inflata]CAI9916950.1 Conserved hypothetical protein [Hexamita inflata]
MKELKFLNAFNNQITDVTPLIHLINITELILCDNKICDVKPLSSLKNLVSLDLEKNKIHTVDALCTLCSLEDLNLSLNQITDADYLAKLVKLDTLCLYKNNIIDISFLTPLSHLKELHLQNNKIQNSSVFEKLNFVDKYIDDQQIPSQADLLFHFKLVQIKRQYQNLQQEKCKIMQVSKLLKTTTVKVMQRVSEMPASINNLIELFKYFIEKDQAAWQ